MKANRFKTAAAVSREFNVIMKRNLSRQLYLIDWLNMIYMQERLQSSHWSGLGTNKINLVFATHHATWSEEKWKTMHFSDESMLNLFGSDGIQGTFVEEQVKHCHQSVLKGALS